MPTEIQIQLSKGAQDILDSPGGVPMRVFTAIKSAMNREMELTASAIVEKRMSFPRKGPVTLEGLRVETGRLRRSMMRGGSGNISKEAEFDGGNTITGSIGTNVGYAAIHEHGGTFTRQLRDRSRAFTQKFKFGGKTITRTSVRRGFVQSHSVTYPARRPIGRTIDERKGRMEAAISAAIEGAS